MSRKKKSPPKPRGGMTMKQALAQEASKPVLSVIDTSIPESSCRPVDVIKELQKVADNEAGEPTTPDEVGIDGYLYTDHGNAKQFAYKYAALVKYDHTRSKWFIWKQNWWIEDETGEVYRLTQILAEARYSAAYRVDIAKREKAVRWALRSDSAAGIQNTITVAKTIRPIADSGKNWDRDAWLLGVSNGVVDLRTGELRRGKPDDRITKHSPIKYDPDAKCPRWEQAMQEIFCGDQALIDYVQCALGYCLTGDSSEDCFFICWGDGANGKTTFIEAVMDIFGPDYSWKMPFDSLLQKKDHGIPHDIADLEGRRFVTAVESNEGAKFDMARLKEFTGGDKRNCRRLFREARNYDPTDKIWLATNNRPEITETTDAAWRRPRLIPFLAKFAADDPKCDKNLPDKLRAEYPGILAWIVQGCLKWQKDGLGMPPAVKKATDEYRQECDHLGKFFEECCDFSDTEAFTVSSDLRNAYSKWLGNNPEAPSYAYWLPIG